MTSCKLLYPDLFCDILCPFLWITIMQSAFTRTFHCLWSFPHWTKSSNDLEFPIFRHPKHHMSSLAISPSLYYSPIVLGIIQWSYDIPWIFVFADFAASHHLIGRSDVSQWTAMARCWPVHPTISRSLAGTGWKCSDFSLLTSDFNQFG